MDIYSWNPESRTPFFLYKRPYGVCESVRVATLAPPRRQHRGVVGEIESVDADVFRISMRRVDC